MKRILSIMVLAVLALGAMAQSPVVRNGNNYLLNGQNMNKREFKGYLQNTCPEAFAKFNSGYKTAIAGWALFGTGLGLEIGGAAVAIVGSIKTIQSPSSTPTVEAGTIVAGSAMYATGAVVLASGIVCLAVGYARMHNSTDVYNVGCAGKPVAEFNVTAGGNGIGLACRF